MSHCHCCNDCKAPDTSASSGTTTLPTPSEPTPETVTASAVATDSSSPGIAGKKVLIVPILTDLVSILVGEPEKAEWTPFLHLAAQAVEFELADRLMDKLDNAETPTH